MIRRLIGLANNYKKINAIADQQKSKPLEKFLASA